MGRRPDQRTGLDGGAQRQSLFEKISKSAFLQDVRRVPDHQHHAHDVGDGLGAFPGFFLFEPLERGGY
jgi:hypothetical protein